MPMPSRRRPNARFMARVARAPRRAHCERRRYPVSDVEHRRQHSDFSLIDSLWMRMLPVKAPDRLVLVTSGTPAGIQSWSYPVWEQIRDQPQLFDSTTAWFATRFDLASGGETQFVNGLEASG